MYKTKGLLIGAILLTLVLIPGLACGAKPAQEPAEVPSKPPTGETLPAPTEITTADNYTTYTDEARVFSISYPADWEADFSLIQGLEQNAKDALNKLKSGQPLEDSTMVFLCGHRTKTAFEPNMNVSVVPIVSKTATYDQIIAEELQSQAKIYQDFQETFRLETTVDGRKAVISEWEGTPEKTRLHFLQLYTVKDRTVWIITCISLASDFSQWQNDFNTIVRSLRIYY